MIKPKHKLYATAETLFIENGMTCAAISQMLGIREATLSEWRKSQKWEEERKRMTTTSDAIRKLLLNEFENISRGNKANIDTDGLSKVAKALQYFEGRVALSVVISVLKEFDNWMLEIDPAKAIEISKYHQMFAQNRAKTDSLK